MEVLISNFQDDVPVNLEKLKKFALFVLSSEGISSVCELSIALMNKDKIRELNLKYRGIDLPTDVLSFPCAEELVAEESLVLGDVVISPQVVREQAEEFGTTFEEELLLLLAHGVLHLLGYDHEKREESKIMQEKEKNLLTNFMGEAK
ncbi:MAG: rRNA maturation RNase YbeY [Candidatus Subteraquimicrobiales bacterium]|nr:rRNA maturation RNase YbeY [Candidatus Subteraquimicrobiales bacterium]